VNRLGILLSGRGSNFEAIADNIAAGSIDAEIAVVISNRSEAPGLAAARARKLNAVSLPSRGLDREIYDRMLADELRRNEVDLVCLAGWLCLLEIPPRYEARVMNIHPALLPQFKGLHTHRRALDAGVKQHGATVHFVVEETDAGPIVLQQSVPVLEGDSEETLAARVLEIEHRIYPEALRLVAEGHVKFAGARDEACAR
jgi:phosphoribosylglycinamide formyltransferase-1